MSFELRTSSSEAFAERLRSAEARRTMSQECAMRCQTHTFRNATR